MARATILDEADEMLVSILFAYAIIITDLLADTRLGRRAEGHAAWWR